MPKYQKIKSATIAQQKAALKLIYPNLIESMSKDRNIVDCVIRLQPSYESQVYRIRLLYKGYGSPHAWMIDPPLRQHEGQLPHHLYLKNKDENGNPELCVYDPDQDKWNSHMLVAQIFVPWIITWLYTYEIWLITGEWIYPEGGQK